MALRTPTKGSPLGTYNRNIRESQRVKGSPKEGSKDLRTFCLCEGLECVGL